MAATIGDASSAAMMRQELAMDQALVGLRVIDISSGIAGAYCTKLLADFGADVIVVESPGGSPLRQHGPFASGRSDRETGALHLYLGTNKRGITLDTSAASGAALLQRLVASADVLVEDGLPGALEAIGLGMETRREQFPRLVTTRISAFGQDGPYASAPATNLTTFAMGGQMALTGDADREPLKNGGYQADYQAGLNGFTATLAGLWAAGDTEQGDEIDVSAIECMTSTLELMLNAYAYLGIDNWRERRGNIPSAILGIYPCADGYVGVHAMPRNWPALLRLTDMEWMLDDERFRDQAGRLQNEDELRAHFYVWAADKAKKDIYARAGSMRAPVAYVHDMADLLASPQLAARGYFHRVDHPLAGTQIYPGAPFHMADSPWREGRAPLLGEYNDDVYRDLLGLTACDLAVLHGQGII
jgi:crotonobetainyl-CoA:carnitine CoA-transferase CaiB-like acyl-CoA transferase